MNNDPKNFVRQLIEYSKKINSKAFNITRCSLLSLMAFNRDGLPYRELKSLLNISDGKLKSNLDFLLDVGYIRKISIRLDQKDMHIYMIDESGEKELKKIVEWVEIMKNLEEFKND